MVWAFRIATGRAAMPNDWIELLSETEAEAVLWKGGEFLNELRGAG